MNTHTYVSASLHVCVSVLVRVRANGFMTLRCCSTLTSAGVMRDGGQLLQPLEDWEGMRSALQRHGATYTNATVSVVTVNVTAATPFDVYRTGTVIQ